MTTDFRLYNPVQFLIKSGYWRTLVDFSASDFDWICGVFGDKTIGISVSNMIEIASHFNVKPTDGIATR